MSASVGCSDSSSPNTLPLRRQVHAGAERAARAGDDDRADGVVGARAPERVLELVRHGDGEGVETLGTVERERQDAVGDRVIDGRVGHGGAACQPGTGTPL